MEEERQYNGQKKKDKRKHIDLQNSFTCTGLKYFVDRIRAFSNIRTNAIMRSLIFPYANAEHVTSLLAIFVNMKTEPVFVNFKLHRLSK
jgi:hypothetical protein